MVQGISESNLKNINFYDKNTENHILLNTDHTNNEYLSELRK